MSRYGTISIAHTHQWSIQGKFTSTPYMQDLLVFSGQQDNYQNSCELIEKYLRVPADDSQVNRLCVHYGTLLEEQTQDLEQGIVEQAQELSANVAEQEVVYAMCDGCMLPTRPHKVGQEEIGSWKEMKLGRIFREQDRLNLGEKPNVIRESLYVSHFGKQEDFTDKLCVVTDKFERLKDRLVFINDGAVWIANFIKDYYPDATNILDFYHASEYLHGFAKGVLSKQLSKIELQQWVDKQIDLLFNDGVDLVIEKLEQINVKGKQQQEAKDKILNYYRTNQHRMLYKTYRARGLLVGSGPIESAHRFVLQKRMKQSGQKWTKQGGQAVANLRVFHLNNQWNKVIGLINEGVCKAA